MKEMLTHPLIVVAHDAGAANHIFAWLAEEQATMFLDGPARALWQLCCQKAGRLPAPLSVLSHELDAVQSSLTEASLSAALVGAATVITGTGWESNLEHDARKMARDQGIRSIAVIDHWTNYAARFVRNGEEVLPDEIWVVDPYAADIAQATFPTVRVVEQPNLYLLGFVSEVESHQLPMATQGNDRVLYVLEPIRHMWGNLKESGEFLALEYFITNSHLTPVSVNAEIRLRPHPSDPPGKYDAWLSRQDSSKVSLDRSATLAEAIAWSNVVAGCQTYAMVLALACRRTVISTIPPWAPSCVLPHRGIIKMADWHTSRPYTFLNK